MDNGETVGLRSNAELAALGLRRRGDGWMLAEVAAENVTKHGRSFRLWSSETDYETVTPQIRRLLAKGLVVVEPTYHDRGIVRLAD